jgi:hypothetical protein
MNKDDSLGNKTPSTKKSSSARMGLATSAAIIASIFSVQPGYTQTQKKLLDSDKKNTPELVEKNTVQNRESNDSTEHQKIIKTNIQDILSTYGKEK